LRNVSTKEIEFILAVNVPESSGKFKIQDITQGGQLCQYRLAPNRLFITPAKQEAEIDLLIKYEGKPRQDPDDFIRRNEIVLRMDGAWLPILPSTCAEFEVFIQHPLDYTFFGQGIREGPEPVDEKWAESRWSLKGANGFTLYGAPEYKIKKTMAGGTEIKAAVWPRDAHLLNGLSRKVTDIMHKLVEKFAGYPYPVVRIVESGRWDGRSGYGAISNVSIGYQKLREGIDSVMIAHELTHGWWGGIVPTSHEALFKGQWNETLAEYTSSWALEQDEAERLRKRWSLGYASLDEESDTPMLEIGSYSAPHWKINEAITYHKGALLMVSLEDLVGLVSVKEALYTFVEKRSGKPSTWEHLLNAIKETCGIAAVQWLKKWLSATSAPDLKFAEINSEEQKVTGKLLQIADPFLNGQVEIGFYHNETLLETRWLSFKKGETPFQFIVPYEANRIIIDPRYRMPRRYDPNADPKTVGSEISI